MNEVKYLLETGIPVVPIILLIPSSSFDRHLVLIEGLGVERGLVAFFVTPARQHEDRLVVGHRIRNSFFVAPVRRARCVGQKPAENVPRALRHPIRNLVRNKDPYRFAVGGDKLGVSIESTRPPVWKSGRRGYDHPGVLNTTLGGSIRQTRVAQVDRSRSTTGRQDDEGESGKPQRRQGARCEAVGQSSSHHVGLRSSRVWERQDRAATEKGA